MKETEEKGYSPDGENYFDKIDYFMDEFCESGIFEIYEAKKKFFALSDFISTYSLFDNIIDGVFDELGEVAENIEFDSDKHAESFKKAIDEWAKKEGIELRCWGIHSERKIKIKIDIEKAEYEILKED